MIKKAVIISGGNLDNEFCLAFLSQHEFAYCIAADRGMAFMKTQGLTPTHVVGDFDSVDKDLLHFFEGDNNIEITKWQPEKDFTDTQLAVEKALMLGSQEIWILGGTGTRLDHLLANVKILNVAARKQVPCYLLDEHNKAYLITTDHQIKREKQYGKFVSVFAMGESAEVTLRGFKYPLTAYPMTGFDAIGVSNEIVAAQGEIHFKGQALLVIESHD